MKVTDMIQENLIICDLEAKDRDEVFDVLSKMAEKNSIVEKHEYYKEELNNRERMDTTALENLFAIPHAKSPYVKFPAVLIMKLKNEIIWDDSDNKVKAVISLAIPEADANVLHMKILSRIAMMLMDDDFVEEILEAQAPQDIKEIFVKYDKGSVN